jgi:hypothetical protein
MNWLGLIVSLFGTWLAGRKTIGWLVAALGNIPWVIHAVLIKDLPLGISATMFGIIGLNNYALGKGYGITKVFNRHSRDTEERIHGGRIEDGSEPLPSLSSFSYRGYGPFYDDGECWDARFDPGYRQRGFRY